MSLKDDAVDAGIEAAGEAVSGLPSGQKSWDQKEYMIAKVAAEAAVKYMLPDHMDYYEARKGSCSLCGSPYELAQYWKAQPTCHCRDGEDSGSHYFRLGKQLYG